MAEQFKYAHATSPDWREATQQCIAQMGEVPVAANLGFIYVTDFFAASLQEILALLKESTGVMRWVGSTGVGICATSQEYFDRPAVALMLGEFPADSFRVFEPVRSMDELQSELSIGSNPAYFGIVHGDPENQKMLGLIELFAARMESGFVVGGLTSSRQANVQVADGVTQGGLSGVGFTSDVALTTRLTQGVSPLGGVHLITECDENIIISIDNRPALDILREDIGEVLSRDLGRLSNYIFVGLPITGSDTSDYLVRNLVGIDVGQKLLAIGDRVEKGGQILFCRRDGASAVKDMQRMLDDIKAGIQGTPKGGVYFSCLGRGESMFGPGSEELKMISRTLGDMPLVGFFANGEISHNRLYGYTGVLTVFY